MGRQWFLFSGWRLDSGSLRHERLGTRQDLVRSQGFPHVRPVRRQGWLLRDNFKGQDLKVLLISLLELFEVQSTPGGKRSEHSCLHLFSYLFLWMALFGEWTWTINFSI